MYICLILYYRHVNFYSGIDMYYSNQIKINTHISEVSATRLHFLQQAIFRINFEMSLLSTSEPVAPEFFVTQ